MALPQQNRAASALYTTKNTALEHRSAFGSPNVNLKTSVPGVCNHGSSTLEQFGEPDPSV